MNKSIPGDSVKLNPTATPARITIDNSLSTMTDILDDLVQVMNNLINAHNKVFATPFERLSHDYLADKREVIYQSYIKSLPPSSFMTENDRPPIQVQIQVLESQLKEILLTGRNFVDTFNSNF